MPRPKHPRNERQAAPARAESPRLNRKRARMGKSGQRTKKCAAAPVRRSPEIEAPYLLALHRGATSTGIANNAWIYQDAARYFLSIATQQITHLMELPEPDRRPDEHAHSRAQRMLVRLSDLNFGIAPSDVYTDPDTAIRLLWSKGGRNVELVFPSGEAEPPYVYHSNDREYGVEETPDPQSVLNWLNWVLNDITPEHVRAA